MLKMIDSIFKLPTEYERFLCITVYDHMRDKEIIEMECTPCHFYSKVTPNLLIKEGFSEYAVYLINYVLNGGWVEYYNKLSDNDQFHFCYEKVPVEIKMEKFISWLRKREKTGGKNLTARIKNALESGKFLQYNPSYFSVLDVFDIPPRELYKCYGVGRKSIEILKNHFMDVGLDWFHFHKFKMSILK